MSPNRPNSSTLRLPLRWAAIAPILCAVHCLATPLLVTLLPAFARGAAFEIGLLALSAALAVGAVVWGLGSHGRWVVLVPILGGLAFWAASLAGWLAPVPEPVATPIGSLLVAVGLVWNGRLRHRAVCPGCGCPASKE